MAKTATVPDFLSHEIEVRVRFSESDAMQVVWHGHYVRYFEDAREAFGRRFGISYEAIRDAGIMAPVVHYQCDIKQPARFGEVLRISARLIKNDAAKMEFQYTIRRGDEVLATGESLQVFVGRDWDLLLQRPGILQDLHDRWDELKKSSC